jgi:hypothetical protein
VRKVVRERDGGRCIFCYHAGEPNAHFISRARLGLGIEENVVTLCAQHHYDLDHGKDEELQEQIMGAIREYLEKEYPGFPDSKRLYNKYAWMEDK